MSERPSFSHRRVFVGFALSLLAAAGAAIYLYVAYIRYDRGAALHLPQGTAAALRLDLEKVVLYEPVRRHLLPLANELPPGRSGAQVPARTRLERVQSATGIELGVDLRELVLGWGPGPADWVLIVGGRFPRTGVLDGLQRVLGEEGAVWHRSSDGAALISQGGIALGQAVDGTLIAASNEASLRAALPLTDTHQRLELPTEGPGGFALQGDRVRALIPVPLRLLVPPLRVVDDIEHVHGDLALGPEVVLSTQLRLQSATAEQVVQQLQQLSQNARRLAALPGVPAGPVQAAERLAAEVNGPQEVRVTASWTRDEVDAAARELAGVLRTLFGWAS